MNSIRVMCVILLDDGERYFYSENPEITVSEFSQARGTTAIEEQSNFKNYAHSQFNFEYKNSSSFEDLVRALFDVIGFKYELAFEYGPLPLNILVNDKLIYVENLNFNFEDFINKYGIESGLKVFLIYMNQAGSIWKDDGVEYYMNSKESGSHNRPHVHIDYNHEYEASIAIDNGDILAGKIPGKILKIARKRIADEKEFLFECWNTKTDGLKIDINHYFGKKKIEDLDKVVW